MLKGITLSGSERDTPFFAIPKRCGGLKRRVELAVWNDVDDTKRLIECVSERQAIEQKRCHGAGRRDQRDRMGNGSLPALRTDDVHWHQEVSSLTLAALAIHPEWERRAHYPCGPMPVGDCCVEHRFHRPARRAHCRRMGDH